MRQLLDELLPAWRAAEEALDGLGQWHALARPLERVVEELRRDYRRIVAAGDVTEAERRAIRARIAEAEELVERCRLDS